MKTKHTPGPWTVTDVANEQWNGPGYWVAHLDLGPHRSEAAWPDASATVSPCLGLAGQPVSKETIEANARLIAAAPDMLAALERLVCCVSHMGEHPAVVNAHDVIMKARRGGA